MLPIHGLRDSCFLSLEFLRFSSSKVKKSEKQRKGSKLRFLFIQSNLQILFHFSDVNRRHNGTFELRRCLFELSVGLFSRFPQSENRRFFSSFRKELKWCSNAVNWYRSSSAEFWFRVRRTDRLENFDWIAHLFQGKTFNRYDVAAAISMSIGLVFFTLADSKVQPNFNLYGEIDHRFS